MNHIFWRKFYEIVSNVLFKYTSKHHQFLIEENEVYYHINKSCLRYLSVFTNNYVEFVLLLDPPHTVPCRLDCGFLLDIKRSTVPFLNFYGIIYNLFLNSSAIIMKPFIIVPIYIQHFTYLQERTLMKAVQFSISWF